MEAKGKCKPETKICAAIQQERKTMKNKKQRYHVYRTIKKLRCMHTSDRIEEMVCELEGYRWDAMLLSETWRHDRAEIWETHHKHRFMGAGRYDNKHGCGIMLNKKWRRIIDTEYINERAISTTIVVNRQHIKLMSVYFTHSGYADHHIEKCTKRPRCTRQIAKYTYLETKMQNWDLVKEPNA